MSDNPADPKRAWLARVLNVRFAETETAPTETEDQAETAGDSADFAKLWASAVANWRDASEDVDAQLSQLQKALRGTDDDELHDIAEFGLNGITDGTKVPLQSAILEINSAGTGVAPGMVGKARQAVARFRQQIDGDGRVEACDANPFGVAVSIRKTFAAALSGLDTALKSASFPR